MYRDSRGTAVVIAGGVLSASFPLFAADLPVTLGPPITVTATRVDESPGRYLIGARVITAQDIERSGASNLSELLRAYPEVRTRELPGTPNTQVDMRGFGLFGDQNTLVLLDGMRFRDYEQLTVNWSSIPLSSIERIEIIPAGGGVIYGGGGTGGVINIVTRAPERNALSGYVGAGVGSYNTLEARAGVSAGADDVGIRLHGSHFATDNYRDNQRVRIDSAQADVRWTGRAGSLGLKFGIDDQRNGLPGVISEAQMAVNRQQTTRPHDFATQDGGYVHLSAQSRIGDGDLTVNAAYRTRRTGARFLVGTPFRNNVDTEVDIWTLAPQLRLKPEWGAREDDLIVGAYFDDWDFNGRAGPTIPSQPHSTQRSAALYAHYAVTFPTRTMLAIGAREQRVQYDVQDAVNAAARGERKRTVHAWDVSARQFFTPEFSVYVKHGASYRLPSVNDNFNPTFARVTLLEPQTSRDTDVGLEGKRGTMRFRALAYHLYLSNEIFFDPLTLGSRNRQATRRWGFEVGASWQALSSLVLHGNYLYADATFRGGQVGGVAIGGNRVPIAPRHILTAGLSWSLTGKTRLDVDVRYVGSSVYDADETNRFARMIPGYTVTDLKMIARRGGWLFNLGVQNLFNEKYYPYAVFDGVSSFLATPAQERAVFASAQYGFR